MTFSEMDPLKELGSLKTKRGHTLCPGCHKWYNNKNRPLYCTEDGCNGYIGGDEKNKDDKSDKSDARMITSSIASVRAHRTGVAVRIFVDLKENKVCKNLRTNKEGKPLKKLSNFERCTKRGGGVNQTCSGSVKFRISKGQIKKTKILSSSAKPKLQLCWLADIAL